MIRGYRLLLPGFLMLCVTAIGTAQDKISVKEGDTMPDITLPATSIGSVLPDAKDAKSLSLSAFKGKKNVVLFFYPRAMTKGCTIESCGFRDTAAKFA